MNANLDFYIYGMIKSAIYFTLFLSVLFIACSGEGSVTPETSGLQSGKTGVDEPGSSFSSTAKSSSSVAMTCAVATLSSSSVDRAIPCSELSEGNCYGTITDKRDNQDYKVVKIGEQWWMAENLNYQTENSFCYNDSAKYCEKYGRLYTWAAAIDSVKTGCGYGSKCCVGYPARGICPEGWHVPIVDEFIVLDDAVVAPTLFILMGFPLEKGLPMVNIIQKA